MTVDFSEVRAFAARMEAAPKLAEAQVRAVVEHAGMNMKRSMREKIYRSKHFKGFASSISYDVRAVGAFGGGFIELEIGPEKGRPGSLANIAYFGTSRGGGTVPDPQTDLDAEAPRFVSALEKLMGDLL